MRFLMLLFFGTVLSTVTAHAGIRETITSSCKTQFYMSPSQCSCVVNTAEKTFSPKQMEFFLAVVTDDENRRVAAQSKLTMEGVLQVAENMENIPIKCGGN